MVSGGGGFTRERGWLLFIAPVFGLSLILFASLALMAASYFAEQYADARDWNRKSRSE